MIDLHIHTNNSDGSDTVIEILKKANELKLEYISITDHDNCNSYEMLKEIDILKYYNGQIIPGIEIKCSYGKRLIEVLGYKINTNKMSKYMYDFNKNKTREYIQNKYFNILYEKCMKINLKMLPIEEIEWNPKNDWASVTIYKEMKRYIENEDKVPKDLWEDFDNFSKKYCSNPENIFYIDKTEDYLSLQQSIDIIRKSGGLVFLPHLFIYKWAENKEEMINNILKEYKIDGIECMHSSFSKEQIEYLLKLCKDRNYYISGGSDYHGKNKIGINLGIGKGNLKIEKNLISSWV